MHKYIYLLHPDHFEWLLLELKNSNAELKQSHVHKIQNHKENV